MTEAEGQTSPNGLPPETRLPQAPRPVRRTLSWLAWVLLLALLAGAYGAYWLGSYAYGPAATRQDTVVLIPKGAGAGEITTLLADHLLLKDDLRFLLLAKLTGSAGRLKAGEYCIPARATPLQILRLLEEGKVILKTVTIPEGLNVEKIAALLARDGWVDPQRFISLARDPNFILTLNIDQPSLEGYLFPDTYRLTRGDVSEEAILRLMTSRFHSVWKSITATGKPAMSRHHVVTLASIVEKETGAPEERTLIARVFLNRLARDMRLQSDPTVIYGIEDFDGDLTRRHLRLKTPYNTYVIKGLPPGPICNPGREAIEAVLQPDDNPYLFFVSKNDGTHHFSITLTEHNRAVSRYQKIRTQKAEQRAAALKKEQVTEQESELVTEQVTEEVPEQVPEQD
ncbi:MAG: endolytic transglycosylase MltG [Desulfobulbaceae bacterium]